jgi:hypothetical protein
MTPYGNTSRLSLKNKNYYFQRWRGLKMFGAASIEDHWATIAPAVLARIDEVIE